jgi:hypothetical protein
MNCSNCDGECEDGMITDGYGRLSFCDKCRVLYGKNRDGFAFMVGNDVNIKDNYHSACVGRIFNIRHIFIHENSESGRVAYLVDKETERPLKGMLDVNWLNVIIKN